MTPSREVLKETTKLLANEISSLKNDITYRKDAVIKFQEDIESKQKEVDIHNTLAEKLEKLVSSVEDEDLINVLNKLKIANINKAKGITQFFFPGMNDNISDHQDKIKSNELQINCKEYLIELIEREISIIDELSNMKASEALEMEAVARARKRVRMVALKQAIRSQVESFKI